MFFVYNGYRRYPVADTEGGPTLDQHLRLCLVATATIPRPWHPRDCSRLRTASRGRSGVVKKYLENFCRAYPRPVVARTHNEYPHELSTFAMCATRLCPRWTRSLGQQTRCSPRNSTARRAGVITVPRLYKRATLTLRVSALQLRGKVVLLKVEATLSPKVLESRTVARCTCDSDLDVIQIAYRLSCIDRAVSTN